MAQKKFSELEAGTVDGTSIFAQTKTEDGSLVSKSASSPSLAGYIGTSHQFVGLNTNAKNLVGAINEAAQSGGGASVVQLTQAEYDLLDPAVQANGSIYKITDNAKMYCLDEEYHAVKELTTAEYEALTTAQQNNGTIYIQTDAETTGEDIPVSSSVSTSVADKIDEFENKITTQTVDGVSWTIKRNGKFYEMWADITIDASAATPIPWGSLYIYRNPRLTAYQLPVKLAKKVCDLSFSNGVVAAMTTYYTDISIQENEKTSADVIRPTTTTATIVVHKYICGYVN